jgi:hypothetical protein
VSDTQFLQLAYDTQKAIHPHQLAVVFLVMALGVMFDLHRPACTYCYPLEVVYCVAWSMELTRQSMIAPLSCLGWASPASALLALSMLRRPPSGLCFCAGTISSMTNVS